MTETNTSNLKAAQRFCCPRCLRGWSDCVCPVELANVDVDAIYRARIAAFEREPAETPDPVEFVRTTIQIRASTWEIIRHRANGAGLSPDEWIRRALRIHGPDPLPENRQDESRVVVRIRIGAGHLHTLKVPPTSRAIYRGATDAGSSARIELGLRVERAVRIVLRIERDGAEVEL